MNWMMAAALICGLTLCTACSKDDDAEEPKQTDTEEQYTDVPLIIMDTDIASSTDDLFALMMLHRYQDQNRIRLLGVVVDREGEECAACADVMNTFYGHGDIPLALIRDGIKNPAVWINYKTFPKHTDANGKLMFQRSVADYSTLPDGWQLYRQLLAAQPDHSVSIVSTGFVTCLAQLLQSAPDSYSSLDGVELIRRKVKCIYLMGGVFGEAVETIEFNFAQGLSCAKTFFQLWPADVDIIMSPGEVGDNIEYPTEQVIADIDWTDVHPIKQVYMHYDCNTGQKMWDPLTVINAVEGDNLFTLSPRGTVVLTDNAETLFTPSPTGNIRYQIPREADWNADMLERIRNFTKIK